MIIRLFSIFDPSRKIIFSNWIVILLPLTWVLRIKFFYSNLNKKVVELIVNYLIKETKLIIRLKFERIMFFSTFFFIMSVNLLGLLPYVLAAPRHIRISLSLGLTLWLSFIFWGVINNINSMLSHLVPLGCPNRLMFFMVVIETVRIVIRPLTLAVRLSANIMAGHVILGLISSVSFYRTYRFVFRALVQIIFFILELSVALIQPYVFFTLISLYKSELN